MTATIIPYPIVRRQAFIRKQAEHAAYMKPDASARYLQHQLKVQADAMRRRGVPENLIARELECMEVALRAALLRASLSMGAT